MTGYLPFTVNLIVHKIREVTVDLPEEEKPIILPFNPWNFTSQDQLLQQYFRMLADQFSDCKDKKIAELGSLLTAYGTGFESIPKIGKAAGQGAGFIGRLIRQHTLHGADVYKQRHNIIKYLNDQKRKIIITIDDIDRLTNDEIQLIFKLVSSVANFTNTIFLLSFDKDIVVNALKGFQGDISKSVLCRINVIYDELLVLMQVFNLLIVCQKWLDWHIGFGFATHDNSPNVLLILFVLSSLTSGFMVLL